MDQQQGEYQAHQDGTATKSTTTQLTLEVEE